jgi:hypothetical protein
LRERERENLRRRAAEEADLEVLEAVLDGGLSFYCALQFYDCPFWAFPFTAIALHSNLHSSFPFLFLFGLLVFGQNFEEPQLSFVLLLLLFL